MKKETLADKLARKAFEAPKFQQSWQVHYQAFQPILEPAFVNNFQAKIHLTDALNLISNRNFTKGLPKLQEVQKHLETDADKAAYLFFVGLYCEMAGKPSQMAEMYDLANEYGHGFYLPYMKAAKYHHQTCQYDVAADNYARAIDCFNKETLSQQETLIVASAYANMATCLTMMHRYDEAMQCLEHAHSFDVKLPDSVATSAILSALAGEQENAKKALVQLKESSPASYDKTKETVESIFQKNNPAFFPVETDSENINTFWLWFKENWPFLASHLNNRQYEQGMTPIAKKLLETFPFMEEPPYIALGQNEKGYVIELHDMYFVAVRNAFDQLLAACPEEILDIWQFVIVH